MPMAWLQHHGGIAAGSLALGCPSSHLEHRQNDFRWIRQGGHPVQLPVSSRGQLDISRKSQSRVWSVALCLSVCCLPETCF